jgi:septal ring factor EnvC (AmiA/AmiB activator)
MVSWQTQQQVRKIKEMLGSLAKNRNLLIAIAFVALFAIGFYINVYTARIVELSQKAEEQLSTCQSNLTECETNSAFLQEMLGNYTENNTFLQNTVNICMDDRQKLTEQIRNVSFELANYQANYSVLVNTFNQLNSSFEQLANSSATNICCKRKIDDSSLKYFYIQNGIVYCTADLNETLGTKQFTCPSLAS